MKRPNARVELKKAAGVADEAAMQLRQGDNSSDGGTRLSRVAWLASFVVPVIVLVLLCIAKPAHSMTVQPPLPGSGPVLETEEDEEEGEWEDALDECGEEESQEAVEECEELVEEQEELEATPYPPEECVLKTASASIFSSDSHDKVRLVVRYTAVAPAEAVVDFRLKGGKGSLKLGEARERLAAHGAFHIAERLSRGEVAKVQAAKSFTVEMRVPGVPHYCRRYNERHLTIKHSTRSRTAWLQSDSIFGAGGNAGRSSQS
jgi:hypothetical protein